MVRTLCGAMFVFMLLAQPGAAAQSGCEGQFEGLSEATLREYDPFAALDAVTPLKVSIRNTGMQVCQYRVYFLRAPEIGAFGPDIDYDLRDAGGSRLLASSELALETANSLLTLSLEPSTTGTADYAAHVPRGQYSRPADLDDTVTLILTPLDELRELDRMTLRLRLNVASVLDISISGAGVGAEVDFGTLVAGRSRTLMLEAFSNEEYALSIASENYGALVHSDAPATDRAMWSVPYALRVDGAPAALESGAHLIAGGEASQMSRAHEMIFTIVDAGGKRAGLYEDILTVRIVPKL